MLDDLTAWLTVENVRGAIIGGVAASVLGRPRMTRDVDALVLLDSARLKTFLAAGSRFGFKPRLGDAVEFATRNRVLLASHEPSKTPVDIALGFLPFEEESIARSTVVTVAGVSFPVVSPEDLMVMKAVAHRPRDVADIESLLDANPKLDLERVRYWVGQFASVLEAPEILNDLEAMLARRVSP
ncbi:MAG TPA: nucleotidyl transferase AbiEii/AbiGii toxin family protein [Blastocatellia bacterium]|nr:nucleotidyl transferase AbiEii/AbiGii toxin family protein [Blastocatellia bacterium]